MKRLKSALTNDLGRCIMTGSCNVHIHHIFYGPNRKNSEKYGYIVPLDHRLHTNGPEAVHNRPNQGLDLELKQKAQRHFEEHHGSRDDFREIFGKSWL